MINLFKSNTIPQLPPEHDWKLISKSYSPPRKDSEALSHLNLSDEVLEKLLCGVTTYYWECANTGDVRKEEILGNDADELAGLAERVERTGEIQYVQVNGAWYGFAKVPPPQNTVPIK